MIEFLRRLFFYSLLFADEYTGTHLLDCAYAELYPRIKREVERTSILFTLACIFVGTIINSVTVLYYILFFFVKSPDQISEFWTDLGNDIEFIFTGDKP